MPNCSICKTNFPSDRGLSIHVGRMHKSVTAPPSTNPNQASLSQAATYQDRPPPDPPDHYRTRDDDATPTEDNQVECHVCKQVYQSYRALRTHFTSHPVEANLARANNLRKRQGTNRTPSVEQITPQDTVRQQAYLRDEVDKWYSTFDRMANNLEHFDQESFYAQISEFQRFLYNSTEHTPGPIHPATVHYQMRRKRRSAVVGGQISKSSNPERRDRNTRARRRAKFEYDLAQFEYYYRRRKIARKVLDGNNSEHCPIPMDTLYSHFASLFGEPNNETLDHYPQDEASKPDISISIEEVKQTISRMKIDSSPGYDRILMRTVKDLNVASTIQRIIVIMLATGSVPPGFREGKTILIHKGGDPKGIGNWRPVTMYSILRRITERVLDKQLRQQVHLDSNQRGFVMGMPGCHVNSALVNRCLTQAKRDRTDCTVVFLDITKAFDRIGHEHIRKCLKSKGVSSNLIQLIMALLSNNSIRIDTGRTKSDLIYIQKSVPQGGPLSPMLFNIAIDHVFSETCDTDFANKHGCKISSNHDALLLTGFADDQTITAKSPSSAIHTIELVTHLFQKVGLEVNPRKSTAINISKGKLDPIELITNNSDKIFCIGEDERIRYLGCSFKSELVFDDTLVDKLTTSVNNLLESVLLKPGQKLNILNEFLFPRLIYPLQAAPLRKIPRASLLAMDLTIRNSAKAIMGLPTSTNSAMFYSPRKFRGTGLVRCEWEAYLQHHSMAIKLSAIPDTLFHEIVDCQDEINLCLETLGIQEPTTRLIRAALREAEFTRWSQLSYQGVGVIHFRDYPKANRFTYDKNTLSDSEWTAAIKLNTGYANLVGVPGVQTLGGQAANLCRRCGREKETPSHVLGTCHFTERLRNTRHHKLKHKIADLLREKGFQCITEAQCLDGDGRNRFVDILAVKDGSRNAFIIDPTVRWESNEDVGTLVQDEKTRIYSSCADDLRSKYPMIGNKSVEVIGLWVGARGTISNRMTAFFDRFGLNRKLLPDIAEEVLTDSIHMIHNHIYGPR